MEETTKNTERTEHSHHSDHGSSSGHGNRHDGGNSDQRRQFSFRKRRRRRKKVCQFCTDKGLLPDYKDSGMMRRHVHSTGKILSRRNTGTCAKHQRLVKKAVKRARNIALVAYTQV